MTEVHNFFLSDLSKKKLNKNLKMIESFSLILAREK